MIEIGLNESSSLRCKLEVRVLGSKIFCRNLRIKETPHPTLFISCNYKDNTRTSKDGKRKPRPGSKVRVAPGGVENSSSSRRVEVLFGRAVVSTGAVIIVQVSVKVTRAPCSKILTSMSSPAAKKEFCDITGASDSKAEQFLKYANWDLQVH